MKRIGEIIRKTAETNIRVRVNLDGSGECKIRTGVNFLDHMLKIFAEHSGIDLEVEADGDLIHHIVEDTAICLGKAISEALGKREKIKRFGYAIIPMDDALVIASIDLKERSYCNVRMKLSNIIEDLRSDDITHFIRSFADNLRATIHIYEIHGSDSHHKAEAAIKALAISIKNAIGMHP